MADYVPINPVVFTTAYAAAYSGMLAGGGRVQQSGDAADYATLAAAAGQWAEAFDTAWNDVTDADTLEVFAIQLQSFGLWSGRQSLDLTVDECGTSVAAIIASITAGEAWFAGEAITPPAWGSGGGGGGSGVPLVPANSAGELVLTSINATASPQPAITGSAWEPPGPPSILTFTKDNGSIFELGQTDASPTFAATYTETPESALITYTQQPGSPLTLAGPSFDAGTIAETFTFASNGATVTFQLQATFLGSVIKNATLTDAGYARTFFGPDAANTATSAEASGNNATLSDTTVLPGTLENFGIGSTFTLNLNNEYGALLCLHTATPHTFTSGGFPFPMVLAATFSFVNQYGAHLSMDLYYTGDPAIADFTVSVAS